ncbi:Nucleotide-binding universal stress protein, UspA family [Muriicola jejuensis]|uniref:Universal stress protein n=1 Tax=Muriicola jejuensis TaxID=504488 RepID=A0A6P0U953_9FLAO|nr:universal stress protein [Muriicola jejuensis]NER09102.1 universal stress protein [Muriicola jejuensis]SMP11113.1 Nucleotide-binding universal stress protein, UspA family [Muriicola jejuensis]
MKTIILPTDFSKNAYNAITYAMELFKNEPCRFYLLNTYTPAIYESEYILHSPGQIGLGDIYQSLSMENLEDLKKKLEKKFKNPKHTFIVHSVFNLLVDEVCDLAVREKVDMIIMGTQGATGAKEIFLGSHTVHVIKKAPCPVLAIPAGYTYEKPKAILFPTDFEVDYQHTRLSVLMEIAAMHTAAIHVLHVSTGYELNEQQERNKSGLSGMFSKLRHEFHDLPSQEIIDGINGFKASKKVDLLAMVQNKHTFLERLFIEPVIKKIGFHITIPFLVLPHPNE